LIVKPAQNNFLSCLPQIKQLRYGGYNTCKRHNPALFNPEIFTQIIYTAHKQLTRMLSPTICWANWKIQKHVSNRRKKVQEIQLSENYFNINLTLN